MGDILDILPGGKDDEEAKDRLDILQKAKQLTVAFSQSVGFGPLSAKYTGMAFLLKGADGESYSFCLNKKGVNMLLQSAFEFYEAERTRNGESGGN